MKSYIILSAKSTGALEQLVNLKLNQGWTLAGGVAVENEGENPTYYWQATTFFSPHDMLNP